MNKLTGPSCSKKSYSLVLSYVRSKVTQASIFQIPLSPNRCVTFPSLAQHAEPDSIKPLSRMWTRPAHAAHRNSHVVWPQKSHGHNHGLGDCPKYPLGYFPESKLQPQKYHSFHLYSGTDDHRSLSRAALLPQWHYGHLGWVTLLGGCPGLCRTYRSIPGLHPLLHARSTIPH